MYCLLLMVGEQDFALTFSYLNKIKLAYYSNNNVQAASKPCEQNMKPKFTLVIISVIIMNYSKAQVSYGVEAGMNISNWKGDAMNSLGNVVDLSNGFISTKSKTGIHIGGYLSVPITEQVSFQPCLYYSQKGYAMKGDIKIDALKFLGVNATAKVESNYIDIPLLLNAEVAKGLHVYAGPQFSYLTGSNLHVNTSVLGISLLNKKLDITDNFNRMDVAIAGGVGYAFDNGFNIKAGYDYGLGKLDKNDNFKAYNRVVKLSLGFSF